ncbi:hypothetical protein BSR28_08765 [Boudabousia liubingyangii]|uniref:SpaH/EbpB family LPXTG-anchored major pilin n=1 Tax=Boudabousia liubingyangii TaxID=1921764 RepID=UPI00093CD601|nr:SpaH/EbpB family LPXTG-anchored major pilin [Boudabousia liubingyangii]OKL45883.1 hypothetical protein BSR28_08765 [Boudabousia liubingyangii]
MTRNIRKTATGLTVAAVALMGLGSSFAVAAPTPEASVDVKSASSIDQATGSIKVTKLTPSSLKQDTPEGNALSALPKDSKPIEGVTFTAYQIVGLDVHKNADWVKLKELKGSGAKIDVDAKTFGSYTLKEVKGQPTDENGVVTLDNLPVAFYVVAESISGETVKVHPKEGAAEEVPAGNVVKAEPFVVSVPLTNPENTSQWLYDVNVYPKNATVKAPVKTLNDDKDGKGSGNEATNSQITYTLSAEIPSAKLNQFMLIDRFKDSQLKWIGQTSDEVFVDGEKLDSSKYTIVETTNPVGSADEKYRFVTLTLTEDAAKELQAKAGKKVTWEFHANVKEATAGEAIPNKVFEIANPENEGRNQWNPEDPTQPNPNLPKNPEKPNKPYTPPTGDTPEPGGSTPGNEVKSYYGKVVINKKASDDPNKALNGAKFELYQCDPSNNYTLGDKISVNNKSVWESGKDGVTANDGKIVISGLLVNDYRNGDTVDVKDGSRAWSEKTAYCLKEIEAPEGYELLPQVAHFQVLKGDSDAAPVEVDLNVTNIKKNGGFNLPVTGGAGIATLVAAGTLLVAGSGAYVLAASRKRKQA